MGRVQAPGDCGRQDGAGRGTLRVDFESTLSPAVWSPMVHAKHAVIHLSRPLPAGRPLCAYLPVAQRLLVGFLILHTEYSLGEVGVRDRIWCIRSRFCVSANDRGMRMACQSWWGRASTRSVCTPSFYVSDVCLRGISNTLTTRLNERRPGGTQDVEIISHLKV